MRIISSLLLSLLIAGCGGAAASSPEPTTGTGGAAPADTADPSCPVAVPGTSVTVEDTDTGAALVFVTTGDVAELRRRVAAMAEMHNEHHGAMGPLPTGDDAGGHAGHHAHGEDMGHGDHAGHGGDHAGHGGGAHAGHGGGAHAGHAGGMIAVHSQAAMEEIEGGARLAFIAGAADVAALQEELRMHAKHLASGTCAMDHAGHGSE